jgi:hypothetical protein
MPSSSRYSSMLVFLNSVPLSLSHPEISNFRMWIDRIIK